MCVDVEPGRKTGTAVAWKKPSRNDLSVVYSPDKILIAGAAPEQGLFQQDQVLQQQVLLLLQALQQHEVMIHSRDGRNLTEWLVQQDCVRGGKWL